MLTKLKPESDELLHLDALRFVAALGIVALHYTRFCSAAVQALLGDTDYLRLFVDLFFCISGFVIAFVYAERLHDRKSYQVFLRRRVARLGPLHWATFLFFLLIGFGVWSGRMHTDFPDSFDPHCVAPSIFAVQAFGLCPKGLAFNGASWSISAEMGMYVAVPFFFWWLRRWPIMLLGFTILALLLLPTFGKQPWFYWTHRWGVLRAIRASRWACGFTASAAILRVCLGRDRLPSAA